MACAVLRVQGPVLPSRAKLLSIPLFCLLISSRSVDDLNVVMSPEHTRNDAMPRQVPKVTKSVDCPPKIEGRRGTEGRVRVPKPSPPIPCESYTQDGRHESAALSPPYPPLGPNPLSTRAVLAAPLGVTRDPRSETRDPLPLLLSRRHRLPITLANAAFATAFTTTFHRESRCLAPILPMSSQPSRQW